MTVGAAIAVAFALAIPTTAMASPSGAAVLLTNVAPVATSDTVHVAENTAKVLQLKATDADNNPLTFSTSGVTLSTSGSLSGLNSAGQVLFTPARDFVGTATFTFVANDGTVNSAAATETVIVDKGNSYPTAKTFDYSVNQDGYGYLDLDGDDADPGPLTYQIVSGPQHGVLGDGVSGRSYKPNAGYYGPDQVKYTVTDGGGLVSYVATVNITVVQATPAVKPPVANAQSVSTLKDTPLKITLTGSGSGLLRYAVKVDPANGTLTGEANNLVYTPKPGFVGTDSFKFVVKNDTLESAKATINITVNAPYVPPANQAPVAKNLVVTTVQNTPVSFALQGSDPDNNPITYSYNDASHGDVTGTAPNVTYTPDKWFSGKDAFTYTVSDGKLTTTGTVYVIVRGFKHRPVAYDQSVTTGVRHPIKIDLNGWSGDRDDLDYFVVGGPDHGRLVKVDDDTVIYVPNRHFRGTDSFDFIVRDEDGNRSRPATVTIKVKPYWGGHYFH